MGGIFYYFNIFGVYILVFVFFKMMLSGEKIVYRRDGFGRKGNS